MNLLLPFWMRVGVTPSFRLWLPVGLLWPVWIILLFLFLGVALIATLGTGSFAFGRAFAATRELHNLAAALRGAECQIQTAEKHFSLSFI